MSKDEILVLVDGKTFEEIAAFFKSDPKGFEQWRLRVLQEEISRSHPLAQKRLHGMLNGLEIKMSYFGDGIARYNAVVDEFFTSTLYAFNEVLQGNTAPPEVNSDNIVSLFEKDNKSGT